MGNTGKVIKDLDTARRACLRFEQAAGLSRDGRVDLDMLLDTIEALTRYQDKLERT